MFELIRFILAAVLIVLGLVAILLSLLGVFKFRFVLNRMHCAAMTDTMGALCIILGLMIATGGLTNVVKLAMILLLVWVGSPISSHLIGRMEVATDENLHDYMKFNEKEVTADEQRD